MAFTWTVKIIPIDIPKKIISVNCIVVDTADNNREYQVSSASVDISKISASKEEKDKKETDMWDILWKKFLVKYEEQQKLNAIQSKMTDLENAAKANLEGRKI